MCVSLCVRMCFVCVLMCMRMCVCVCICVCMYMCVCECVCVCVSICAGAAAVQIICSNDRHQERRAQGGEMIHPTSVSSLILLQNIYCLLFMKETSSQAW